jgi:hypothetical protein
VGAQGLGELLLQDLDLEALEVGQSGPALLLLDLLAEARSVELVVQLVRFDRLPG